jgi:DNA (cytosine-5)-methyltransferase 1
MALRTIHLFAGAGGGILADLLLGHQPIAAVEIEAYPRGVLLQRQIDGCLPRFPVWDDVQTFRADNPDCAEFFRHAASIRDNLAICGGFPCQDISAAGRGAGITGERSGLWSEFSRIIGELRPRFVFVENSPMLTVRGLGTVLGDLAEMGYNAEWCVLGAHHVGAPHKRDRIWILADAGGQPGREGRAESARLQRQTLSCRSGGDVADADRGRFGQRDQKQRIISKPDQTGSDVADAGSSGQPGPGASWYASDPAEAREGETAESWHGRVGHIWGIESRLGRVAHGVANRTHRLRAIGNGQVPVVAATAWRLLEDRLIRDPDSAAPRKKRTARDPDSADWA